MHGRGGAEIHRFVLLLASSGRWNCPGAVTGFEGETIEKGEAQHGFLGLPPFLGEAVPAVRAFLGHAVAVSPINQLPPQTPPAGRASVCGQPQFVTCSSILHNGSVLACNKLEKVASAPKMVSLLPLSPSFRLLRVFVTSTA